MTPRSARAAGVMSVLLLGAARVLARSAVPADPTEAASWVKILRTGMPCGCG